LRIPRAFLGKLQYKEKTIRRNVAKTNELNAMVMFRHEGGVDEGHLSKRGSRKEKDCNLRFGVLWWLDKWEKLSHQLTDPQIN
jgi:hypothetical protein